MKNVRLRSTITASNFLIFYIDINQFIRYPESLNDILKNIPQSVASENFDF